MKNLIKYWIVFNYFAQHNWEPELGTKQVSWGWQEAWLAFGYAERVPQACHGEMNVRSYPEPQNPFSGAWQKISKLAPCKAASLHVRREGGRKRILLCPSCYKYLLGEFAKGCGWMQNKILLRSRAAPIWLTGFEIFLLWLQCSGLGHWEVWIFVLDLARSMLSDFSHISPVPFCPLLPVSKIVNAQVRHWDLLIKLIVRLGYGYILEIFSLHLTKLVSGLEQW